MEYKVEDLLHNIVLTLAKEAGGKGFISYDRLRHDPDDVVYIYQSDQGITLEVKSRMVLEQNENI